MTDEKPQLQPIAPLTAPMKMLAIVAHHDDIEFGMAGSIARWVNEGADVTYIIITDGGAGSNTPGIVRAELAEQRKQEQLAAAAAVGVSDVRFLGYPDGVLQPTMELRRDLTRLIRELKPDRVMLQDPTTVFFGDGYINHPDHRAAGEAALYAVFPSAETRPIFPELLEEGFEPHHVRELFITITTKPTHFVDVSSTIEQKFASLRAHVSQIGTGEAADNGALKWIRERMAEGGKELGVEFAESFKVMTFERDPAPHDTERQKAEEARIVANEAQIAAAETEIAAEAQITPEGQD
jgi:LmbE family N-acetylglucosaminyl deacetylase